MHIEKRFERLGSFVVDNFTENHCSQNEIVTPMFQQPPAAFLSGMIQETVRGCLIGVCDSW